MLDPTRLVISALIGLVILLVLIIKFKVQAMIAILIGAVAIGLMAGMPYSEIVGSVNQGIGETLKGIALLVGLGSMFGAILEASGGAQTLAVTMVRKFGDQKAAWALGITGCHACILRCGSYHPHTTCFLIGKAYQAFHAILCHSTIGRPCCRSCFHTPYSWSCIGGHHAER